MCIDIDMILFVIIYLQCNIPDTTTFPTRKYNILYHATRVIFFCITILHVLPTSQAYNPAPDGNMQSEYPYH